ncbi:MAG: FtsX-like permease family protein [Candidatus Hodarchaeota archaeon]
MQDTIDGLKDRLRFEFWGIIIREHTDNLYQAIDSYLNTRVVVLFMLLPVVILSAFLILFSTNSAYQARKEEVEILKSRGSGTRQIIGVLATEIFLVTISSTVLGIILGFLLTYIIIQSSGFLNFQGFSISSFTNFSLEALKSLSSWLSISFICAIIFFLIGLRQVFNFMREGSGREKQKSKLDTFVSERFLDIGALIIALLGLIYLIQSGIVIKILMDPAFLGVFLFLTLLLWFGFAGYGARIFGNLFSSLEGIFKRLFSNRVILALKNLERRQGELVSIVMILTITVSIGVFSAVYAQTVQTNSTMQIDYLTGSDFKVLTDRTSLGYVKTLNRDQGIEKSTAIATGVATIAQDRIIGIMGIDTLVYDEICHWDASSTSNVEEDHTTILERLRVTPYGVIINELIARRLQLGVGDDLHLSAIQWDLQLSATLEIVGIMHSAPGIGLLTSYEIKLGAFRESFGAVLVNQHLLWNPGFGGINTSTVFLAKASTQDVSEMLSTVERVQELPMTRRVYSPVLTEQTLTSFLDKTGVSGILTVDLGIATIVGVLGLTFFLSFIVDERRQEYAIMRAVGSQRRHILLLILFESSTFVVFSFFAGSFIGILFSWLFTTISLSSITLAEPIIPYFIDFPIPLLSLSTFIFFISMLLGILFPALKASKTEIVTVLKNL